MVQPQYVMPLPFSVDYAEENFIVSDANRAAFRLVKQWPEWRTQAVLIQGPAQSGKTHLAHIWEKRAGACIIPAKSLTDFIPGRLGESPHVVVEDIEGLESEIALVHLYNHLGETGGSLMLTTQKTPGKLPFKLPDLRSRLGAAVAVVIHTPDDVLLEALLVKQFSDRQLKVGEGVIVFMMKRLERSYAALQYTVELLDKVALEKGSTITVPMVSEVLES